MEAKANAPCLGDIQSLVNALRNWLDFCIQFLFYPIKIEAIVVSEEIDGQAQMPITSGSTYSVQVGLRVLWKIEVDHNIDRRDINPTRE